MTVRAHVWVSGLVQGVGFRWYASRRAAPRGVAGWIRNLPDSRVEAVFEGYEEAVRELVAWCHGGPTGARVSAVEERREDPEGLTDFEVRH